MSSKLRKMYYGSVRLAGNIAIDSARFCVKHVEVLSAMMLSAGVVAFVEVRSKKNSNERNNTINESERLKIRVQEVRLEREMVGLARDILALDKMEACRYSRRKPDAGKNGVRRVKGNILENLDNKRNRLNRWADEKIRECNRVVQVENNVNWVRRSYGEVARFISVTATNCTSWMWRKSTKTEQRGEVSENDDLPSYESVMREDMMRYRENGYNITPSAPSEDIVFGGNCIGMDMKL